MKRILYCAMGFFVLSLASCETNSLTEELPSNEILSFDSMDSFNSTLDSISLLNDSALCEWNQTRSFESLQSYYDKACEELFLSESEEKYSLFVRKYSQLIFNYEDEEDYSVYCPVENYYKRFLLNKDCEVLIDGVKVCMKDYLASNYPFERETAAITRSVESGVNSIYVSANHRRLRVVYTYNPNMENKSAFYISTRKKFLGGWASYNSNTYFEYPNGSVEVFKRTNGEKYYREFVPSGMQIKMWSDGVGSANKATMTISNE